MRLGISGLVAGVLVALALGALVPAEADASLRCRANGTTLRVDPYADDSIDLDFATATVRRDGDRILVLESELDENREAVDCKGPQATVANTERIVIFQTGLSFASVSLRGGAPAPQIVFRTDFEALGYGIVIGTDRAEQWRMFGDRDVGGVGLSLDPAQPERPDVVYEGFGSSVAVLEPRAGDDRVDLTALTDRETLPLLYGGRGADALIGSKYGDSIEGGRGRDQLEGGGGNDRLVDHDRDPDRIDCGRGKDTAFISRGDAVRRCEKVDRTPRRGG